MSSVTTIYGVVSSSLQVDSQFKLVGLVWQLTVALHWLCIHAFIVWTKWTLGKSYAIMTVPRKLKWIYCLKKYFCHLKNERKRKKSHNSKKTGCTVHLGCQPEQNSHIAEPNWDEKVQQTTMKQILITRNREYSPTKARQEITCIAVHRLQRLNGQRPKRIPAFKVTVFGCLLSSGQFSCSTSM